MSSRVRFLMFNGFFFLILISGYSLAQTATAPSAGDGSAGDPYLIATVNNLYWVTQHSETWGSEFLQTTDIDALSTSSWDGALGFSPIGSSAAPFTGAWHGAGHIITDLFIDRSGEDNIGMFGKTNGAVIDSLGLINCSIVGQSFVGGLAGYTVNGSISNSFSAGSVTSLYNNVGGLIGQAEGGVISQCYAASTVRSQYAHYAGGLFGTMNCTVNNSYAAGSVFCSGAYAGGLMGVSLGIINSSYSNCSVISSGGAMGGVAGYIAAGSINDCYWNADNASMEGVYRQLGGTIGTLQGLTNSQTMKQSNFSGWDFVSTWVIRTDSTSPGLRTVRNNAPFAIWDTLDVNLTVSLTPVFNKICDIELRKTGLVHKVLSVYNGGSVDNTGLFSIPEGVHKDSLLFCAGEIIAPGDTLWGGAVKIILHNVNYIPLPGAGTAASPFLLSTYSQLKQIKYNMTSVYRLTEDIDASASSTENGGAGFEPIGILWGTPFKGTFHGGGHSIMNLHINRPTTDGVGLFGYTNSEALIDSLAMIDVSIQGLSYVGGLVGYSSGVINYSYTSGTVSGATGGSTVGGISGSGYMINGCSSSATVTGVNSVGGLTGTISGVLTNSFSSGTVTATSSFAGGLIGSAFGGGTVTNCYSSATVFSNRFAGGIIGATGIVISHCYAVGVVTGGSDIGALEGRIEGGSLDNSYWCSDVMATGVGTVLGGTLTDNAGMSSAQMKVQENFSGWDFTDVWQIVGSNYPTLRGAADQPLPVELVSFTATTNNKGIELRWKTAAEVNNYGFEIQRSEVRDQRSEFRAWMKVGFVDGSGTTNAPSEYSFVDKNLSGGKYIYRLKQIDRDGKFTYSTSVEVSVAASLQFGLEQNFPNPFNPMTTIGYSIPLSGFVSLNVFDALGREVRTLVNEEKDAGTYSVRFDGSSLSSGLYFYSLRAGTFSAVKKFILVK